MSQIERCARGAYTLGRPLARVPQGRVKLESRVIPGIRRREKARLVQLMPPNRRQRLIKSRRIAAQQRIEPRRARRALNPTGPAPARGVIRRVHMGPHKIGTVVKPAAQLVRDNATQWRVQPRGAGSTLGDRARDHPRVEAHNAPGPMLRRVRGG